MELFSLSTTTIYSCFTHRGRYNVDVKTTTKIRWLRGLLTGGGKIPLPTVVND